ncbi:hypothetical protein [Streptomyces sp. NPDC004528]|uniref:hypothetical protein n=1 Tax=Streptomyces sp. NPDC004528 TaxID=3154550 RepID=UPI0033A8C216
MHEIKLSGLQSVQGLDGDAPYLVDTLVVQPRVTGDTYLALRGRKVAKVWLSVDDLPAWAKELVPA